MLEQYTPIRSMNLNKVPGRTFVSDRRLTNLKARSSAQQMLCNIIDHYQANDCVGRLSPTLPTHLTDFDDRLSSRLMGGLPSELKPPGKMLVL